MKFCWVTINVKDMEKSLHFYQEVIGLNINRKPPTLAQYIVQQDN